MGVSEDTGTDKYFSLTSGNVLFVRKQTDFPSALDHRESNHAIALKICLLANRRCPGALPLNLKKKKDVKSMITTQCQNVISNEQWH